MADVIEFTDQVIRVGTGTSTQPLEQALDVAPYAQLELLLGVHEVGSGSPGPTVDVLTAMDARVETGWQVAASFAPATGANQWQRLSVRNLLRYARLRVATGTSSATISVRGLARRSAVPLQPTEVPGLQAWYRADGGLTLNGGTVSAWADQSGQGNDLVQATSGLQPTYRAASDVGQRPGVEFKAGQSLELGSLALGTFSIAMVVRASAPAGMLYEHSATLNTYEGSYVYGSTGASIAVRRGSAISAKNDATDWLLDGRAHAVVHRFDGTHDGDQLWVDGIAVPLTTFAGHAADPGTAVATQLLYVGSRASASLFLSGTIREIVIYDRAVSDVELKALSGYLRRNAGLE